MQWRRLFLMGMDRDAGFVIDALLGGGAAPAATAEAVTAEAAPEVAA